MKKDMDKTTVPFVVETERSSIRSRSRETPQHFPITFSASCEQILHLIKQF